MSQVGHTNIHYEARLPLPDIFLRVTHTHTHTHTHIYIYIYIHIQKGVSKSSRTVLVKRSLLTLDVKFLHHLQSTPLLHEYCGPSISAMLGGIPGSPYLELCQVPTAIPLESLQWCRMFDPSSEASAWGRGKITGRQIG